jgi:hypothetical protein
MRTKSYLLVFGILLLILNTAGLVWIQHTAARVDEVQIQSAVFSPDDAVPDRIRVVFDRNLADAGQVGKAAEGLFEIFPALSGKWLWESPSTAVFCLEEKSEAAGR